MNAAALNNPTTAAVRSMPLSALLGEFVESSALVEHADLPVTGLSLDSRQVSEGHLFLAVYGHDQHGLAFLKQAIGRGAVAVAWEPCCRYTEVTEKLPAVSVSALGQEVGKIAARWFGHPTVKLFAVGITGTDGKTSTSHLVAQLSDLLGKRCATIGTLGYGFLSSLQDATHTTPDPVTVQRLCEDFVQQDADSMVMEVSSHALDQGRIAGVQFDVVVFTNLGHDHLDYHGDLTHYLNAKKRLFKLPGIAHGVINLDDLHGREWAEEFSSSYSVIGYSCSDQQPDSLPNIQCLQASKLRLDGQGAHFELHWQCQVLPVSSPLLGRFNVSNLLAAIGVLLARGESLLDIVAVVEKLQTISGRYEGHGGLDQPLVVIDYAHTPDALQQILQSLREHCSGQLVCIFGCGGNRDRAKRPVMGGIAEQFADVVCVTNDNPRDESPEEIIRQVLDGVQDRSKVRVELDRARAIAGFISSASPNDVILVAGKGHEQAQIIAGKRLPYSDVDVVNQCLAKQELR